MPSDDVSIVIPDDDDTRVVRPGAGDDSYASRPDAGDETRTVHVDNDQTRVVDRHPVGETRVVERAGHSVGPHDSVVDSIEATRRSTRRAESVDDADPDRTLLSTRSVGSRWRQWKARNAPPASTVAGRGLAAAASVSRAPDAPVGSTVRYGVRAPIPVAAPVHRRSVTHPPVALPATAEQIRRAGGRRARRRSVTALGFIVLVTFVVASGAIGAIVIISGL